MIITDGLENASTDYSGADVSTLLDARQESGWSVLFLGANQDAVTTGTELKMKQGNVRDFDATATGVKDAVALASTAVFEHRTPRKAERRQLKDELFDDVEGDRSPEPRSSRVQPPRPCQTGIERPMSDTVMAATLVAPFDLRVERYPMPTDLEPGAVLVRMLASGICGTDKHTYRGETEQYAGTDHASSTPFPIIQGHENVGVVEAIGAGGATAFDGSALAVGRPDRAGPQSGLRDVSILSGGLPVLLLSEPRELRELVVVCGAAAPVRRVRRVPVPAAEHARFQGARRAYPMTWRC